MYLMQVAVGSATLFDTVPPKYQQIFLQQDDICGLFCHVNSGVNGDSYVGRAHGCSVVDAVAHEANHAAVGPERRDNARLFA